MRALRGYTLAEILVCVATLIPVVLILVAVFPFAYGLDHSAWERLQAQELLRTQLETLRANDFEQLANYTAQLSRAGTDYTTEVQIDPWPVGQARLIQKRATVTVSWHTTKGPQSAQLQTALFKWAP